MLEQLIERILPTIIAALELMGIFIVAVSALSAFGRYLKSLFTRTPATSSSPWPTVWPSAWSSKWPPRFSRPSWYGTSKSFWCWVPSFCCGPCSPS